ncbi:uncharacterized protein LOC123987998 [Osmia bicornis bicornis]|uniref:uncharacterized protein LOC123987998 n=1 Tax=Osmia bicornis bicornis TaxID=1437191 RepID=UPI001EAF7AD6|nr:uncharacterized protein LOC123987998 [Osmia bicornis bicornis]
MDVSSLKDFKKLRICYLHFAEDDYKLGYAQRKLKDNVVPSLNLNGYSEENPSINASVHDVALNIHTQHNIMEDVHEERNDDVLTENKNISYEAGPSISSTPKRKRLRLLQNNDSEIDLTLKAARLYNIATQIRRKQLNVSKTLIGYRKRLREAQKCTENTVLLKLMSTLSKPQQLFLSMQFRNSEYKPQGRRFTMKEKVLALALYKQSGRCYRLLESIFHLPSARSLRQILNRINVNTGCNQFICRQLQEKGTTMSSIDKVCCVMFDEMAIQPHVEYDPVSDCIVGFEDYQTIRTMKYADHALVFMIRGIHTGWKFPVAYYFTENQASTAHLVQCITEIIQSVVDSGFLPVALICDQGKTNVAAINQLKADTRINMQDKVEYSNTIYLAGVEICPLYDPSHLMKGIRNNLLNKDIELVFKKEMNGALRNGELLNWHIKWISIQNLYVD